MSRYIDKIALSIIFLVIVINPLSFGAVHPWSSFIIKTLILSVFFLALWKTLTGEAPRLKKRGIYYAAGIFILFFILQLLPLPAFILKLLGGRWNFLYGDFSKLGITTTPSFHPLHLAPGASREIISWIAFYIFFAFSIHAFVRDRKSVKLIAKAIIGSGFLVAFIAIAQKFWGAKAIYWSAFPSQTFYGTFINPNHCAIYLACVGLFTFAYLLREDSRTNKGFLAFIFTLIAIAIFYSLSRGGIISFLLPLGLLLYYLLKKPAQEAFLLRTNYIALFFILLAVATFLAWWGTYRFFGELGSLTDISPKSDFRVEIWKNSLTAFKDFYLFGTGIGSYQDIIPLYRTMPRNVIVEVAENDYIQLLLETGALGFLLCGIIIYLFARRISRVVSKDPEHTPRVQIGAIFAILAIALNSLINFNFYFPGSMILFSVFAALIFLSTKRFT
jgi:O-antigen ligase